MKVAAGKDPRGIKWDDRILRWLIDVKATGGGAAYELLRGNGTEQLEDGSKTWDFTENNLFLPHPRTIQEYTQNGSYYHGINIEAIEQQYTTQCLFYEKKDDELFPKFKQILSFDEVHVKKGLIFHQGHILGTCKDMLPSFNGSFFEKTQVSDLAQHALVCFLTDLSGQFKRPIAWYPTTTINELRLKEIMDQLIPAVEENGMTIFAMSGMYH